MKIKEEYSQKLIQMENVVNQLFLKLGIIDYRIKQMNVQKENITNNIEKINEEKNSLVKKISQEYGEGYVDPKTWQFYPKENNKENINE